jgi:hypothetical protein
MFPTITIESPGIEKTGEPEMIFCPKTGPISHSHGLLECQYGEMSLDSKHIL